MINLQSVSIIVSAAAIVMASSVYYRIHKIHKNKAIQRSWLISWILLLLTICSHFLLFYEVFSKHSTANLFQTILIVSVVIFPALLILSLANYFKKTIEYIHKRNTALRVLKKGLQKYNSELKAQVKERTLKLENTHKRALKKEQEIQKLKDEFVYIAAHELRNPITSTKWSIELLKESNFISKFPKTERDLFREIVKNNHQLITLIDNLLSVARLETKKTKVKKSKINLGSFYRKCVQEVQASAIHKEITIELELSSDISSIHSDPILLREIIINILTNAIKYTPNKGSIKIVSKNKPKSLVIKVTDTGYGLTKKDLSSLFRKFFRSNNSNIQQQSGTGLGLYITKNLVTSLKGTVTAKSKGLNKGSCFCITIPKK